MSRRAIIVSAVFAAAVAAPSAAQTQGGTSSAGPSQFVPPPATPAPAPAPRPNGGKMTIKIKGGLATRRTRWVVRGQKLVIVGLTRPYIAGQVATLQVVRRGKVTATRRALIKPSRRGRGRFAIRYKARKRGTLRIVVRHLATPQQVGFRAAAKRVRVVRPRAGRGARGSQVVLLQRGLRSLGYAVPVNGRYDDGTARAVLAFRKVNRIARTGYASPGVYSRVFRRRGAFKLRHPRAGRHVEFDWSRQVLVLADRGRAVRTYHASSGKSSTPTVFGSFRFYSKTPGTNAKGMLDANYFIGGYAIHGYPEVPTSPASHGCIRVPNPNARQIYDAVDLGERIFVYR